MTARLQCVLTNDEKEPPSSNTPLWFQQEQGKKSSFLLHLDSTAVEAPVHALIQCFSENDKHEPFLFGGLEMVSNSRNVEVYTSDEKGKETYMKTCRGIPVDSSNNNNDYHKCVIVCNGGPKSVSKVRLKLLSLRPAKCTRATLEIMKLKGRLPEVKAQTASVTNSNPPTAKQSKNVPTTSPPPSQQNSLSQADIGSAMAAVSMMVRVTEERLLQNITTGLQRVETTTAQGFAGFQQSMAQLASVVVSQRDALQHQSELLAQQQETIKSQSIILSDMHQHQTELISMAKSLGEDLVSLRQETLSIRQGESTAIKEANDALVTADSIEKESCTRSGESRPSKTSKAENLDVSTAEQKEQHNLTESHPSPDSSNQEAREKGSDAIENYSDGSDDSGMESETVKSTSAADDDDDDDRSQKMEETQAKEEEESQKPAQDVGCLSTPDEVDGGIEQVKSLSAEEEPPQVGGPHVIEEDAKDCNEVVVDKTGTEKMDEQQNTAMNPVPENHWSVVEGDLLGLDEDDSDS